MSVSFDYLKMEVLCLSITKESFYHNLFELVGKVESGLPLTWTNYICVNCREEFCDSYNEFTVISSQSGDIGETLEAKRKEATDDHLVKGKGCTVEDIIINKRYGLPKNYLVLYWISQLKKDISRFRYQDRNFCPELLICRDNEEEEVLLALYKSEQDTEDTFKKLLLSNFESHLQFDKEENNDLDTVLQDEESLDKNRHLLPKLYGGGRRNNDEAPYVCRWCSPEHLKHKNRGRFQLYGNYKQHFLDYHSSDVPFDEFIKHVKRKDKKWHCKNCGNYFSLSNKVRHQAICKKDSTSSSESSDSSSEQPSTSKKSRKRSKARTSSEEKTQATPKKVSHATQTLTTESIGVGTTDSTETEEVALLTDKSQEKPPESQPEIPNLEKPSSSTQESDNTEMDTDHIPVEACPTTLTKETSEQTQTTNNPTQDTSRQPGIPQEEDFSLILESVREKVETWDDENLDF